MSTCNGAGLEYAAFDFAGRRRRLAGAAGPGCLVLHRGDGAFNENLFYLTGLDTYLTSAIIDLARDEVEVFAWEVDTEQAAAAGAFPVHPMEFPLGDDLVLALRRRQPERIFLDSSTTSLSPIAPEFVDRLRREMPSAQLMPLPEHLARMRMVKDEVELVCLARAARVAEAAMARAQVTAAPGMTELDLAAEIVSTMLREGADSVTMPLVASGTNTAVPDHRPGRRCIEPGEPVLVDIYGPVFRHYCCDHTRTFPVDGQFAGDLKNAAQLVERALVEMLDVIHPGSTLSDAFAHGRSVLATYGPEEHTFARMGHFVGLNEHDPGGSDEPIPGMATLAIEPHIYVAGCFGVRAECPITTPAPTFHAGPGGARYGR